MAGMKMFCLIPSTINLKQIVHFNNPTKFNAFYHYIIRAL